MSISFNEIPQNIRVPFTFIEFDNSNAVRGLSQMPAENINADSSLAATALATENRVTLNAKNKGEVGNSIAVCLNYFEGEELPLNMSFSFDSTVFSGSPSPSFVWAASVAGTVAFHGNIDPARPFQTLNLQGILPPKKVLGMFLQGGLTNPDVSSVFASLGDEQYHIITSAYTDMANLMSIKEELKDRRTALRQIDGICFCAAIGTHSELGTLGDNHNSPDLCIMGTGGSFTMQEKNLLLYDGIATYTETADGGVAIQRLITTYKTSPAGAEDISYLDVNTLLTLSYLRFDFRNYILRKYPRHKLANDGTKFRLGQAIITPKIGKAEAVARFRLWEEQGLVEDAKAFKDALICERNTKDPNRLDWFLPPNLINQFRIGGVQIGFIL